MHGLTGGNWKRDRTVTATKKNDQRETAWPPVASLPAADQGHRASSRPCARLTCRSEWVRIGVLGPVCRRLSVVGWPVQRGGWRVPRARELVFLIVAMDSCWSAGLQAGQGGSDQPGPGPVC